MKAAFIILTGILFVLALSLALTSCAPPNLTPAQQEQLITAETNGFKTLLAAGAGYATGGTAGAVIAGGTQAIRDHSSKNPQRITP